MALENEDHETKANLDPVPAVDPGLPKLADRYVPLPEKNPLLAEPKDDTETSNDVPYAKSNLAQNDVGEYVLNFIVFFEFVY